MCRIKFQGESLGTFLLYEVVIDAIIVDLGVVGSPEPVRIVTVKNHLDLAILTRFTIVSYIKLYNTI